MSTNAVSLIKNVEDLTNLDYPNTTKIEVSKETLRRHRIIAGLEPGPNVDAYRLLRTRILRQMADNGWKTLAITSPAPGVGKTLTSINLSISIAMEISKTVLLVDADLRNPRVSHYFNLPASFKGLANYLTEDLSLEELLINPQLGTFLVLPAGKRLTNSSEMLGSPKMTGLVGEIKDRYESRITVFDMPPVLAADDAIAFAPYIDAVLLVIEDGVTTEDELRETVDLLGDTNLIGTILNKSREHKKNYYY